MKNCIKNRDYYLGLNYTMSVVKDEDEFVAFYKEYPRVMGCGDSELEAVADLKEAFACLIDALLEEGKPIIEPKQKKRRVSILLPENLLKDIGQHTNNRSLFLATAARYVLDNNIRCAK